MQLKRHLVTASYVDDSMSKLDEKAKSAGITILGEMGLDPGIGNHFADNMNDKQTVTSLSEQPTCPIEMECFFNSTGCDILH